MASSMARVYASACERDENPKNFNTVPVKINEEVRGMIEADGYAINDERYYCNAYQLQKRYL